jgi:hypothetical protein
LHEKANDDLHRLREYNSLRHVNMTTDEIIADLNKGACEMQRRIEQLRQEKTLVST